MVVNGLNFFHQLIIILGFSIPVIYIFNKIKLPSIIGFLITGIIIGPFCLRLIDDIAGIQLMADIGVALLLFAIGIEIRLSRVLASGQGRVGSHISEGSHVLSIGKAMMMTSEIPNMRRKGKEP